MTNRKRKQAFCYGHLDSTGARDLADTAKNEKAGQIQFALKLGGLLKIGYTKFRTPSVLDGVRWQPKKQQKIRLGIESSQN